MASVAVAALLLAGAAVAILRPVDAAQGGPLELLGRLFGHGGGGGAGGGGGSSEQSNAIEGGGGGGRGRAAEGSGWSKPAVLLLGDGLTEHGFTMLRQPRGGGAQAADGVGWVAGLSTWYGRRADVLNRGLAGYNAHAGMLAAGQIFDRGQPLAERLLLGVIWYGAADSAESTLNPVQHLPLDEYTAALATTASTLRAGGAESTVLITPPPASRVLNGEALVAQSRSCANNVRGAGPRTARGGTVAGGEGLVDGGFIPPCELLLKNNPMALAEHSASHARRYATAVRELGRRLGLPVVDLWSQKLTGHSASRWATDGLLANDGVSLTAA
eukprot:SAG22_NODE_3650_length_1594_cov_1.516711_1_plen_328_part_01